MTGKPTQDFIPIKEIRDGVVILKDGGLRSILLASSINIALKSEEEQRAVISQFQGFLNSLDFAIEITAQSRRLDIRPYIALLEEQYKKQEEDLLRIQTREYIGFIQWFNDETNIMTKNFFVVVPYSYAPLGSQSQTNFLTSFFKKGKNSKKQKSADQERFEEQRSQLQQRVAVVTGGLSGMGIKVVELGTQEVVEMYYNMFNPGETQRSVPQQQ